MKLGVFDTGLGGLLIAKAIREKMPDIDMLYYGDTLNLPYGGRDKENIYELTLACVKKMFSLDCELIIIACNTAAAAALRKIQQEYLPHHYPDRRVLGVVVPTLEEAIQRKHKSFGLIATQYIVDSKVYQEELHKLDPSLILRAKATPQLVPLIENRDMAGLKEALKDDLKDFRRKEPDCLLLGCTHYPFIRSLIEELLPSTEILSQDEIIPDKLKGYFSNHPEIYAKITKLGETDFYLTKMNNNYSDNVMKIFSENVNLTEIKAA